MRKTFFKELYKLMGKDENVWALTGDLGWGGFDLIQKDFSDRFVNCGASEQAMLGIAVGLAQSGKLPFVYSITPFLIYRPMETIRNYIDHEKHKVVLVGSGRDDDYKEDGFSHHTFNLQTRMLQFENITSYFPTQKSDIPKLMQVIHNTRHPVFLSLKR